MGGPGGPKYYGGTAGAPTNQQMGGPADFIKNGRPPPRTGDSTPFWYGTSASEASRQWQVQKASSGRYSADRPSTIQNPNFRESAHWSQQPKPGSENPVNTQMGPRYTRQGPSNPKRPSSTDFQRGNDNPGFQPKGRGPK